jgi:hypothetical protein
VSEENEATELTIELAEPINLNGGSWSEITVREPTALQVKQAETLLKGANPSPEQGRAYQIMLVSLVSGAPRGVIESLPISKFNRAFDFIVAFVLGTNENPLGK